MKIEVIEVIEHEDGSARLTVDYEEEGKQLLLEQGLMAIIGKYLDERTKGED
jgi:hypothetical protein